ncbi:type VI secretion system baseplate subunit TssE [Pseudoalteromonas fenneropenaei]|uniref:Type VI secretion system baseplate subunit TssE n=1 Tax=Pseudoalteromonas fenneropenaei TaxID=1737459 RepID=A0ABV7CHK7_9GAMM
MALFDFLANDQAKRRLQRFDVNELESVRLHITQLLNARRGVLRHLEHYGLPDVEDIYEGLPYSQHKLAKEIKTLIETFEPRVKSVWVEPVDINTDDYVIRFDIKAVLDSGQHIHLSSKFATGGRANVLNQREEI